MHKYDNFALEAIKNTSIGMIYKKNRNPIPRAMRKVVFCYTWCAEHWGFAVAVSLHIALLSLSPLITFQT